MRRSTAARARIRAAEEGGGGGPSSDGFERRRTRRRPLHLASRAACAACACLLAASAPLTAADNLRRSQRRHAQGSAHEEPGASQTNEEPRRPRRQLAPSQHCPPSHTGPVPTQHCGGYVSCTNGKQTSPVHPCASGTVFNMKTGQCTWPAAVEKAGGCKWGEELFADEAGGLQRSDDGGGGERKRRFCPDGRTGRAPTQNCAGYVDCHDGIDGLRAACPPDTMFLAASGLCEYGLDLVADCHMLLGPSPGDFPDPAQLGHALDGYCPDGYTGRAPTFGCGGFVDCRSGKARRSKMCPAGLKFDVMVMACSASGEVVCEAAAAPPRANDDASAPLSEREAKLAAYIYGCDPNDSDPTVKNVLLPGCASYAVCQSGVELNRFECSGGTYFDGQICAWPPAGWECDRTAIPTLSPSEGPTLRPTGMPTQTLTEFDWAGPIYYPDFGSGVCYNDGGYPQGVSTRYLFRSSQGCCQEYFAQNMAACVAASVPTPAPSPTVGPEWYPKYEASVCQSRIRDGEPGEYETNFFHTYEECCAFDWISDPIACLRNQPVIRWYPVYDANDCRNDGGQSAFERNLYETREECCEMPWIDSAVCLAGGNGADAGDDGGEEKVGPSAPARPNARPTRPSPSNAGSAAWYPDEQLDLCRSDGVRHPNGAVLLTSSIRECCRRFFPADKKECRSRSEGLANGAEVSPVSPGPQDRPECVGLARRPCNREAHCAYNDMWGMCEYHAWDDNADEAPPPPQRCATHSDGYFSLPGCTQYVYCSAGIALHTFDCPAGTRYDGRICNHADEVVCAGPFAYDDEGEMSALGDAPGPPPVPRPVGRPSPPLAQGDETPCGQYRTKKQCVRHGRGSCRYDDGRKVCYSTAQGPPADAQPEQTQPQSNGNPYYVDYFYGACRNDGEQIGGEQFDSLADCCRNPWITDFDACLGLRRASQHVTND